MQLWSVKTDCGSTHEPSMKNKMKLLMQSWSFRSLGHLKFGPRAHVNHQQENVKDNLDVTLVYGKRDLEATKIVVSFFLSK